MERLIFSAISSKDLTIYPQTAVESWQPVFELQLRQLRFEATKCILGPRLLILLQNFRLFVASNALPQQ
jgi:hypothetical protein